MVKAEHSPEQKAALVFVLQVGFGETFGVALKLSEQTSVGTNKSGLFLRDFGLL